MSRTRHNLPDNLTPTGTRCVPVSIPDDDQWLQYFIRAVRTLTFDRHWERDDDYNALVVRDIWDTVTYTPLINTIANDEYCADEQQDLGQCFQLDTTQDAIQFYPNEPFEVTQNDSYNPLGEWYRWQYLRDSLPRPVQAIVDLADDLAFFDANIGYFPNDCIILPDVPDNPLQNIFGGINALASFDFPYVEIKAIGSGEFELELLNVPLGGSAVIMWDFTSFDVGTIIQELIDQTWQGSPNVIFTELQRSLAQFPPESLERNSIEIQLTGNSETVHLIRVYFVPTIDYTSVKFLGYGGGIRSITVCGELNVFTSQDLRVTPSNYGLDETTRQGLIKVTLSYEQMLDAIRKGNNLSKQDIAQRILLAQNSDNILSNVEIDKTTNSVEVSDTFTTISTPDATLEQAKYGGHKQQALSLKKLLDQAVTLRTAGWTANAISNTASVIINPLNAANWLSLITDFTTSSVVITIDADILVNYLYCNDVGTAIVEYAIDQAFTEAETDYLTRFVAQIPSSKWNEWFTEGKQQPLDGYQNAPCYRAPSIVIDIDASLWSTVEGSSPFTNQYGWTAIQNDRLYSVIVTGRLSADDNGTLVEYDGMYTYADGAGSYAPVQTANSSGSIKNSPVSAPFQSNDGYKVIYNVDQNTDYIFPNFTDGLTWSGSLKLVWQDLGSNA